MVKILGFLLFNMLVLGAFASDECFDSLEQHYELSKSKDVSEEVSKWTSDAEVYSTKSVVKQREFFQRLVNEAKYDLEEGDFTHLVNEVSSLFYNNALFYNIKIFEDLSRDSLLKIVEHSIGIGKSNYAYSLLPILKRKVHSGEVFSLVYDLVKKNNMPNNYDDLHIFNEDQLYIIYKAMADQQFSEFVNIESSDLFLSRTDNLRKKIIEYTKYKYPLDYLKHLSGGQDIQYTGADSLKELFLKRNLFSKTELDFIWNNHKDIFLGLDILFYKYKNDIDFSSYENPLELAFIKNGFSEIPLTGNLSNDRRKVLMRYLYLILEKEEGIFKETIFSKDVFSQKKLKTLVDFLSLYSRYISNFKVNREVMLNLVKGEVNQERLKKIIKVTEHEILKEVQEILGDYSFSKNILEGMKEEWSNLDPFYVLLARYNSQAKWKDGIEELRAIIENSKKDDFLEYKFKSYEAQDQLRFLAPELLEKWIKQRSKISVNNKGELVVTITDHTPRFLLTIGNLVQTYSCQNYEIGALIEALPGYVQDANVQAVASFVLKKSDFKKQKDLESITKSNLKDIHIEFDGNTNTFSFRSSGSDEVYETNTIAYAFRRHILKLGSTDEMLFDSPKAFLEIAYKQVHDNQEIMKEQTKEMLKDLNKELGASDEPVIYVPGSRNIYGHYSDLFGGIIAEDYSVDLRTVNLD